MKNEAAKAVFARQLKEFAQTLGAFIAKGDEWTIRGFIDIFKNIYTISTDTKIVSKVLELHLFPHFLTFAENIGYTIELATYQNWYPDLTFISKADPTIKFAVDLKTTYRDEEYPGFCNGFTLGSHGEYFIERTSTKNIQYPYDEYCGHFCLGIIYSRADISKDEETHIYSIDEVERIPAVIRNFLFFAEEKWKIASDKGGSGNTANIGSIQKIDDILNGNGVFAKAGEDIFDDYWANFGKIEIPVDGKRKKLSSFEEYLRYRGLPMTLNNPKAAKRKAESKMNDKVFVPPIKIQGVKTKLVPLIKQSVIMDKESVWVEPFMGSGVVGFNIEPNRAIFADTNPHIIAFYNQIKAGTITPYSVRAFLEYEGKLLEQNDDEHYYLVRNRFNAEHNPLDFLFLNRACFNGMIRFNKDYDFNVPYGHKPQRFAKAYITKIVNQVAHVSQLLQKHSWDFICQSFEITIAMATASDFIYCDPPYIGRHVDYYDSWDEESEIALHTALVGSKAKFMLSTWDHNDYRTNEYIQTLWRDCHKITRDHFYHVGAKETNRNPVVEALLTNYAVTGTQNQLLKENAQISFFDMAAAMG